MNAEEIISKFMGCESWQCMLEFEYDHNRETCGVYVFDFESACNAARSELDVTDSSEFIFTQQKYTDSYDRLMQVVECIESKMQWSLDSTPLWANWVGVECPDFIGSRFDAILTAVLWAIKHIEENGTN